LVAKGYADGRVIATDQIETTDAAARVELSTDRKVLEANGQDAVVVSVSILDGKGRLVHEADNRISFQLSGGGRILGVGNGNPSDHDSDRASDRRAFHGHCVAILQAGAQPGMLKLTAGSPGLKPATIGLKCN
jgi:beta-galactosidase